MFVPLLRAYPAFSTNYESFVREYGPDADQLPNYILLTDLAMECIRLFRDGRLGEVTRILDVVEQWLIAGETYVRDAAIVGFLEDLQNTNLNDGASPDRFFELLGPEAKYWWARVERLWADGSPIIDDRDKKVL